MRKLFDNVFFFSFVLAGNLYAIHGKYISHVVLHGATEPISPSHHKPEIYAAIAVLSVGLVTLKSSSTRMSMKLKAFLGLFLGLGCIVLVHTMADQVSTLIVMLQLYIFGVCLIIVLLNSYFAMTLEVTFWQMLFDNVVKFIRYVLLLLALGVAILQFVSGGINESIDGFLASLLYPVVTILGSFFVIGYWLLIPCWERLVDALEVPNPNPLASTTPVPPKPLSLGRIVAIWLAVKLIGNR